MDLITQHYPKITSIPNLPHDCLSLLPCATSIGGVIILTSNSIIYVDESTQRVAVPVNGWPMRVSDLPMPSVSPAEQNRDLALEGARAAFVDDKTLFIILRDGSIYPLEIIVDGKSVSKLQLGSEALARTTIPCLVNRIGSAGTLMFVGSMVGPSVLLKSIRVEEEVDSDDDAMNGVAASVVVDTQSRMHIDDDDDGTFLFLFIPLEWKVDCLTCRSVW